MNLSDMSPQVLKSSAPTMQLSDQKCEGVKAVAGKFLIGYCKNSTETLAIYKFLSHLLFFHASSTHCIDSLIFSEWKPEISHYLRATPRQLDRQNYSMQSQKKSEGIYWQVRMLLCHVQLITASEKKQTMGTGGKDCDTVELLQTSQSKG